ncbi:hypothetical protein [Alkalicoccus saliphilus]|uniref:hypothetical protein n=1 Tax=Alkalicoccus saliphilus TaxID=200989 RepID=UPI00135B96AA|nr:hypothetical protein [Alkalicoccus saliphilus]
MPMHFPAFASTGRFPGGPASANFFLQCSEEMDLQLVLSRHGAFLSGSSGPSGHKKDPPI